MIGSGVSREECESSCSKYSWCIAYAVRFGIAYINKGCAHVTSTGACEVGKLMTSKIMSTATSADQLIASNAYAGYNCMAKVGVTIEEETISGSTNLKPGIGFFFLHNKMINTDKIYL